MKENQKKQTGRSMIEMLGVLAIIGVLSIGGILGFVEMYIVFGVFTFISSITDISFIIDAVKASAFASILFENNLIIKFLF